MRAQLIECCTGMHKDLSLIISQDDFIYLHSFSRGNLTNGKEQEQHQLE